MRVLRCYVILIMGFLGPFISSMQASAAERIMFGIPFTSHLSRETDNLEQSEAAYNSGVGCWSVIDEYLAKLVVQTFWGGSEAYLFWDSKLDLKFITREGTGYWLTGNNQIRRSDGKVRNIDAYTRGVITGYAMQFYDADGCFEAEKKLFHEREE